MPDADDPALALRVAERFHAMRTELAKLVVGQDDVVEQLFIAILARGHCLIEGVPGLAKTLMVKGLSEVMSLSFRRIQFTPDLMPADLVGTDIIQEDPVTGRRALVFEKGPVFAQMLLADEINRTPPKTQAALLEAMQEHSVTVGGRTYTLQEPFFVLATQNPVEQEGTYPLPEAQKDRFLLHVIVTYPQREQERLIVQRTTGAAPARLTPILSADELMELQRTVRKVPVPDHVMDFVLDIVRRSRPNADQDHKPLAFIKEWVEWGAGPRACQHLILAGKVRALLHNRVHVSIEDIKALALPVMRHRIVPTFNAEAQGVGVEQIIKRLVEETIPAEPKGL
jgi:MoxR-like ATPase